MINFTIKEEKITDYTAVSALIEAAFRTEEHSDHREQFLVERLRACNAFVPELSLVAVRVDAGESGCEVVGHILLTKVEIVAGDRNVITLGLAPVAVAPAYQKQGIGGALIREAHKRATALGYNASILLGHPAYYPKFGYRPAVEFGIDFPFDAPQECCMATELRPDGLKEVHGMVRYSAPFME